MRPLKTEESTRMTDVDIARSSPASEFEAYLLVSACAACSAVRNGRRLMMLLPSPGQWTSNIGFVEAGHEEDWARSEFGGADAYRPAPRDRMQDRGSLSGATRTKPFPI